MSPDFVKLLAISHAGYLAYKVVPKPETAGGDAAPAAAAILPAGPPPLPLPAGPR
jgi:hypothetical protein